MFMFYYYYFFFTYSTTVFVITPNCIIIDFFDRLSGSLIDSSRLSVSFPRSLQVISFEVLRSETGMRGDHNGGFCLI